MNRFHTSSQSTECGGCYSTDPLILFNVRLRTIFRRLCPACVLKFHPNSFCPICLELYGDSSPPPHHRVQCQKCQCLTHSTCVPPEKIPTYHCHPCSDPNFSYIPLKKLKSAEPEKQILQLLPAKALLAAARIAASSMAKAASIARSDAEKRVKEAVLAKKRAREAIERVIYLANKEKVKCVGNVMNTSVDGVVGSRLHSVSHAKQ